MASHIDRRKFLATLGGAAVAWPLAAAGQSTTQPTQATTANPPQPQHIEWEGRSREAPLKSSPSRPRSML
jgi:hypothetical protein